MAQAQLIYEPSEYIPYGKQWIDEDDVRAVIDVLRSDRITQGPKVREFEEAFADYCGARYAVAVTSGTAALHLAAIAMCLRPGDEAITSPITFAASANCALYTGATPAFIDIKSSSYCMDEERLAEYLEHRMRSGNVGGVPQVIIPVHFAGYPCDMEKIYKIASKHNLMIVEDACHALGAEYSSGEKVGSCRYSDMTVFSFHPVKHITTGEGGMITTNSQNIYERLIQLRSHGITRSLQTGSYESEKEKNRTLQNGYYYEMINLGFNYRLTDIQSALGISQLKKLEFFIQRRRSIARFYNAELEGLKERLILPPDLPGRHAWHLYVIQLKDVDRDIVFRKMRQMGIGVQVHYIPVYFHPYYRIMGFKKGICPEAERYFSRAISLPMFPLMVDDDIRHVVEKLKKILDET